MFKTKKEFIEKMDEIRNDTSNSKELMYDLIDTLIYEATERHMNGDGIIPDEVSDEV